MMRNFLTILAIIFSLSTFLVGCGEATREGTGDDVGAIGEQTDANIQDEEGGKNSGSPEKPVVD